MSDATSSVQLPVTDEEQAVNATKDSVNSDACRTSAADVDTTSAERQATVDHDHGQVGNFAFEVCLKSVMFIMLPEVTRSWSRSGYVAGF